MRYVALLAAVSLVAVGGKGVAQPVGTELPPLREAPQGNVSLIVNGDMESDDGWRFSDWPPRPDTGSNLIADSLLYSEDQAHSGRRSLRIDLTTVEEDRSLLAQQSFTRETLEPHDGRLVRMSAWIWLESGPPGSKGGLSWRLWGEPGTPPMASGRMWVPAVQAEWIQTSTEFPLRLGEATRGDITIGMRQTADPGNSPIVYVDDIRLDAVMAPLLTARLLRGKTIMTPDTVLAVKVDLSDEAGIEGQRHIRWNITSADGLTSFAEGDVIVEERSSVVEMPVPELPDSEYGVRIAAGRKAGERNTELLLSCRIAEGPFAGR